jgi:hypothetical protein
VTPWVWRLSNDFQLVAQTGLTTTATACYTDDLGRVFFNSPLGVGLLHTLDVGKAAEGLEQGLWQLQSILADDMPKIFAFFISPAADKKKPL